MKNGGMTLGCITGALLVGALASTMAVEVGGTPYQPIVDRNVFGLKPPPPPPNPEDNKPPPPNIQLQGITTIIGKKRALMKVMIPGKPGVKAEVASFILAEGQREGDIEVLEIDEKEGVVKVNDFGTITNISFKNNGVTIASGPPAGGPPPPPGMPNPGMAPPQPGGAPPGAGYQYQPRSIPMGRTPRTNPTGGNVYNPAGGNVYNPSAAPGVYNPVATTSGTTSGSSTPGTVALSGLGSAASTPRPQQNWPPETAMTPEQAALMGAAYTLKYQKQIASGDMPSIPDANELLNSGNNQNNQQNTQQKQTTPNVPWRPGMPLQPQ
jgi:hypothetical protein